MIAAVTGLTSPAEAASGDLPVGWKSAFVGVLPVVPVGTDLFGDGKAALATPNDAEVWTQIVTRRAARDQLEVLSPDVLRDRLRRAPDLKRTLELAQERYALGLDRWKALRPKEALAHLDRALALHDEALAVVADPKAKADVEFQRGLVLRELGDATAARAAFVAALELDPGRRVQRGYYDTDTEGVLAAAERDLADRPNTLAARWPDATLATLAERLGVDVFVISLLEGDGTLRVVIWDAQRRAPARSNAMPTADADRAQRSLDRAFSAWHACFLQAEQAMVRPTPRKTWFADVGYMHSVWLRHRRTREYLHGPGAAIGLTWEASPGLEVFLRTAQQATLSDANADLLDVFTTTRLTFGIGLAAGPRALRFAIRAGLDLGVALADIATTQDVDCKFFGPDHPRCGSLFSADSPVVWLGIDIALNLRWSPVNDFYFNFAVGNVSYVLSPSAASELNFPLYGAVGFGLPFSARPLARPRSRRSSP